MKTRVKKKMRKGNMWKRRDDRRKYQPNRNEYSYFNMDDAVEIKEMHRTGQQKSQVCGALYR